jgi:hypothetical protein
MILYVDNTLGLACLASAATVCCMHFQFFSAAAVVGREMGATHSRVALLVLECMWPQHHDDVDP